MKKILRRFLGAIVRFLSRVFNYGVPLKITLLLLILVGGLAVGLTYSKMMKKVGGKDDYEEAMRYIEIKDVVQEHYINETDRSRMGQSAAAAMISGLGDKWSYYMTPDEYRSYKLSSANEYAGIGMSISKEESGYFRVISVNPGSAAADAGVSAGMILTSVDGESLKDLSEDEARTLIRSKLNAKFMLGVSGSEELRVDCTKTHESAVNFRKEKTDAGYVQIYNFEAGSAEEAINAIERLLEQNIVALCIDVRGNPGGLASEVQKLLDYLLPAGPLFYTADREGHKEEARSDSMCIQLPMVVLLNYETYAEAEVFAGIPVGYALRRGDQRQHPRPGDHRAFRRQRHPPVHPKLSHAQRRGHQPEGRRRAGHDPLQQRARHRRHHPGHHRRRTGHGQRFQRRTAHVGADLPQQEHRLRRAQENRKNGC